MKILSLVLLMVFTLGTFAIATDGPTEVKFKVKMGTVTFNHAKHATEINDCLVCHHTGKPEACKTCHGVDKAAPSAKKAFHKTCKTCHKKSKAGPTKCKECHVK